MKLLVVSLLTIGGLYAQTSGLTARQLYYGGAPMAPAQTPAVAKPAPATAPKTAAATPAVSPRSKKKADDAKPSQSVETAQAQDPKPAAATVDSKPSEPANNMPATKTGMVAGALHLGLRYNVLIIDDAATAKNHEVDPDTNFKNGDCFQVRLRPNRGGRIYAFNHGTSGSWNPLLPSAVASGEPVEIQADSEITVPAQNCFALNDPHGTDKLFIVLADKEEDPNAIDQELRKGSSGSTQAMMAMANSAVTIPNTPDKAPLVSRDLSIQRIGAPMEANEPPNSVYVVKTAVTRGERMVIEIPIRHE
jgi:hypothetical protein